jgi:putative endonuclease
MGRKQLVGKWGEQIAKAYLERKGLQILAQNVRTPYGEIDLIARAPDAIIFIEVKTRTTASFGFPEEAVDRKKRQHLILSAEAYLQQHPEIQLDWRIDVIAIEKNPSIKEPRIEWFENAVH